MYSRCKGPENGLSLARSGGPHDPRRNKPLYPDIATNLHERLFYHGTNWPGAASIIAEGFQDRRYDFEGEPGYRTKGQLGSGIYITCDFATAVRFACGGIVVKVRLRPGTRVLDRVDKPNPAVIATLKREFGADIVRRPPHRALPRNKHLTLTEAISLFQYHFHRAKGSEWFSKEHDLHYGVMLQMRGILMRYGIDGVGEPMGDTGIVLFGRDRPVPVGLVSPDEIDAPVVKRARREGVANNVDYWLANSREPEYKALSDRAAARWGDLAERGGVR